MSTLHMFLLSSVDGQKVALISASEMCLLLNVVLISEWNAECCSDLGEWNVIVTVRRETFDTQTTIS